LDLDQIRKKIELAKKSVEAEEEPFKSTAFGLVLRSLLSEPGPASNHIAQQPPPPGPGARENLAKFAKQVGVTAEQLSTVFHFENETVELVVPIEGTDAEKQRTASMCVLTAFDAMYARNWVGADELATILERAGVPLGHLSRNLVSDDVHFRKKGTKSSTEYMVTPAGKTEAIRNLGELAGL
jgi:hypothetical protein